VQWFKDIYRTLRGRHSLYIIAMNDYAVESGDTAFEKKMEQFVEGLRISALDL